MSDELKRAAAAAALAEVEPGMRVGLGTGSTARHMVDLLGARVRDGLKIVGVPTSEVTAKQARDLGIPLATLEEMPELDLTIDGADEIGPGLALIKGAGGALLREKIVATASRRMIVIADAGKKVAALGGAYPLPIEVNPFGLGSTEIAVRRVADQHGATGPVTLRRRPDGQPLVTDGGHYILDAFFGRISQPEALALDLFRVPGVVEHGLFLGLCRRAYIAGAGRVETIDA